MTATTETYTAPRRRARSHSNRARHSRLYWTIADALVLAKRNLQHIPRIPAQLLDVTIQPIIFVLLFRYVFGGAISTGGVSYVNYLMPGIFIQTLIFGGVNTGVGLAEDLQRGLVDRFRSLPMARSAVLAGRTIADLVQSTLGVTVMLTVGLLVGFRPHGQCARPGSPPCCWCCSAASPSRGSAQRWASSRRTPRACRRSDSW